MLLLVYYLYKQRTMKINSYIDEVVYKQVTTNIGSDL